MYFPNLEDEQNLKYAIGAVAIESAILDQTLREILQNIIGGDEVVALIEGQSSEWLSSMCKRVLEFRDSWHRTWSAQEHEDFSRLIDSLAPLREYRNWVIHGLWRDESFADHDTHRRPWGDAADGTPLLVCIRSRQRQIYGGDRLFSIGDIERVATEIVERRKQLLSQWQGMVERIR